MIDRRTFLAGFAVACAAPLISGCSDGPFGTAADSQAVSEADLSVRFPSVTTMDPACMREYGDICLCSQLYEPLMRYDYREHALAGGAARSVEVSPDARTVTFLLEHGRTFSNGKPLGSRAFADSWNRLVHLEGERMREEGEAVSGFASLLAAVEGFDEVISGEATELSGLETPDADTLIVHLSRPCAEFPVVSSHVALSPVFLGEDAGSVDGLEPIGNGPYRLKGAFKANGPLMLVPNDSHRASSRARSIQIVCEKDAGNAYKQFEAGNIAVTEVPIDQVEAVRKSSGVSSSGYVAVPGERLIDGISFNQIMLGCNMSSTALSFAELRHAVCSAVDRDSLCEKVLKGSFSPSSRFISAALDDGADFVVEGCSYDPEYAASLIEPVYPAGEDGKRGLRFSLLCSNRGVDPKVAEAVANDLRDLGIEVDVKAYAWSEYRGRLVDRDFDLALLSQTPFCPSYEASLRPWLWSGASATTNVSGFSVPEVDEALESLAVQPQHDRALEQAVAIQAVISEQMPYIPVATRLLDTVVAREVENLQVNPYGVPLLDTLS